MPWFFTVVFFSRSGKLKLASATHLVHNPKPANHCFWDSGGLGCESHKCQKSCLLLCSSLRLMWSSWLCLMLCSWSWVPASAQSRCRKRPYDNFIDFSIRPMLSIPHQQKMNHSGPNQMEIAGRTQTSIDHIRAETTKFFPPHPTHTHTHCTKVGCFQQYRKVL